MRRSVVILAILAAAFLLDLKPASAQGYRLYPWCAYLNLKGGATNCYYSTYEQCQLAISGVGGMCAVNPWYSAYGSYYSFGGNHYSRKYRRRR